MKILVQLLILLMFPIVGETQNLITNPSFEDIDSCYGSAASIGFDVFQWSGCTNWSCPSTGSSDLWCENPVAGNISPPNVQIPYYQYPHSGSNYSGIYFFSNMDLNYREYVQNKLLSPLEAMAYYEISIFVSPNEDDKNSSSCIQAYFSTIPITSNNYHSLPVIPQWKNDTGNYIMDTTSWSEVSGIFKATGGEQYITIGCFDDSSNIHVQNKDPFTTSDLYFGIDDIKLIKLPIEISIANIFTPNGDGINDLFQPQISGLPDFSISIYNRWGNKVYEINKDTPFWNGINAGDGIYFYTLNSKLYSIQEQGFFQLIR